MFSYRIFDAEDASPRAWCPERLVGAQLDQWLQADFDRLYVISTLVVKGRNTKPVSNLSVKHASECRI
ncbi:unnamed protein product [Protopolystoma xenopodis]|uniref:Uncharacterized protein n=1 Tax=Protopolystoma xenopodis TaxID=117903 RepID=A0A448XGY7_9PLAT|nr:unnamed protein product [Protopolystoma xenopodis]